MTTAKPGPDLIIEVHGLPDNLEDAIKQARKIMLKGKEFLGFYEVFYKDFNIKKDWTNEVRERLR